jgi:RNA polymerase sigma factor (sigma-70 family)
MTKDSSEYRVHRGTGAYLEGNEDALPPEEIRTQVRNRNGGTTSRYLYDLPPDERRRYEETMIDIQVNGGKRRGGGRGPRFDNLNPLGQQGKPRKPKQAVPSPPKPAPAPTPPAPKPKPAVKPAPPWLAELTLAELEIYQILALWSTTALGRGRLRALGRLLGEGGVVRGPSGPVGVPRRVARAAPGDTGHMAGGPDTGAPVAVVRPGEGRILPPHSEDKCWALVLEHMGFIHHYARWARKATFASHRAQVWEYDDFVQEGILVALKVAERYDASKGKFSTMLCGRLKWAMFDLVHPDRRQPHNWGKEPVSLDVTAPDSDSTLENTVQFEEKEYAEVEARIDLEAAILALDKKEAWIISERVKGRTLQSIGEELGVTESRISQICTRARPKIFKKEVA